MRLPADSSLLLALRLSFASLALCWVACRPVNNASLPTIDAQTRKGSGDVTAGTDEALDKALEEASSRVKGVEEVQQLMKERREILVELAKTNDAVQKKKSELASTSLSASKKKELEAELASAEKELKVLLVRIDAKEAALKKAIEKLKNFDGLPTSLKGLIDELLTRIEELEGRAAAGPSPSSGSDGAGGGSPGASSPATGSGEMRLGLEVNAAQCLSLAVNAASIGACQADSLLKALGSETASVEVRSATGERCLSVRATSNEPIVEKCNGALVQKWHLRFRTSGTGFRLENAVVTGPSREALCLRGDAAGLILDPCTNPVSYFLKKAP